MLKHTRGGTKTTKKVASAALQTEVINDKEWAKVLKRKGLIVVDVYSDWNGPCTGMASCDRVTDLNRFQGKNESTWMFIHEGRMINLMFGAHCPQFVKMLITELERVQKGDEHEFLLDVSEMSPEEVIRLKIQKEAKIAKETARKSRKDKIYYYALTAEAKARYEAEMLFLTTSLCNDTCLLLFLWIFKDEEGRDKRISLPYRIRKRLNEDLIRQMLDEIFCSPTMIDLIFVLIFSKISKQLLLDGKYMFMRLKIVEERNNLDIHNQLCNILFNESTLSESEDSLNEDCYAGKHCPAFEVPDKENKKNKAVVFRTIFTVYTNTTYPYEDKMTKVPITVFKYDYNDVINFDAFEYDKPSEAKMIAKNIEAFEMIGCEAFLGFAGTWVFGPFHVSENPEKAVEESKLYFPDIIAVEDSQSDDEEKPDELMEEHQDDTTT
ncbi:hypothetical protein P5V15_004333 [Pogonomyrmex californicus]